MWIKSVGLSDFRNYSSLELKLSKGLNIFYGANAQGKTNLLEALFVAGTTRSHKGSKDREMIRLGCESSHIRLIIEKKRSERRIDMELRKNRAKGAALDGLPVRRSVDIFGILQIIFFSPEDLNMIKEGPGIRRRFIDTELSQIDKVYLYNLTNFNKVLKQRNDLLKQISSNSELEDTLDIWDEQLVNYGLSVIKSRQKFMKDINEIVGPIHKKLSGGIEMLKVEYLPYVGVNEFEKKLISGRKSDIWRKTTQTGPHRDDIIFKINENDARKFGSQGQQRTAALSLKLAEIELTKRVSGEEPVLLLDDVLSELDRNRQNLLLSEIGDIQTMITCTGLEEYVEKMRNDAAVFQVRAGSIYRE